MIYADPNSIQIKNPRFRQYILPPNAKYVVLDKEKVSKIKGKKIGRKFKVLSNKDIDKILESAKKGLDFVIIEVKGLENNSVRKYNSKTTQNSYRNFYCCKKF